MCACSLSNIFWQRFAGARLQQELLALQAQLSERRQAEPVPDVALPAGQQVAYTISTAEAASEPPPAELVPSCSDVATPLEVSAAGAASTAGYMTGATALLTGEPTASPIVLDDLDVVPALRSPAPLALTAVASDGPAAPVGEAGASSGTSMTGFGSPIASPSSATAAATTAALPVAAVLGNESAQLADPGTILPQEPSTSLHAMALAGPQESATPALRMDAMSPFGASGLDSDTPHSVTFTEFCEEFLREAQCSPWTPGPAAVIGATPPIDAGPDGPPTGLGDQYAGPPALGDQYAGPPADPAVRVEAGFGSPIASDAPTTVAAATGNHKHLLPCFTAIKQGLLLMTCK